MSFLKQAFALHQRIAGVYDPNEDYSGKYMTAFYFEDSRGIPYCHCTHYYLGEQDQQAVHDIIDLIDEYFAQNPPQIDSPWSFDNFDLFGPEKDCPVMERTSKDDMLLDLRDQLAPYRKDKFPVYRPHVTLGDTVGDLTIDRLRPMTMKPIELALVSGNQKVKSWKL